jgi:hypothetical protein
MTASNLLAVSKVVAMMNRRWLNWSQLFRVLLACLALTACKADDPKVRGQLMVVLQTDMSLPKDVTQVKILVKMGGKPYHDKNYIIAPGENWKEKLPATLAVVASVDDPTPRVEVTVVGLRKTEARVFAQAVTTIPEERTATLFVPIQWLCEGQVAELPKDAGYVSTCEPKNGKAQACRAGTCEDVTVDEEDLDDYDPSDVFGGADDPKDGLCFDTLKCFQTSFPVVPNEDCIVELGVPEGYELNLALFNPENGDGICNSAGDRCYIPLDRDNTFGWGYAKGTKATSNPLQAQLPEAVCTKLQAGEIQQLRATLECATKTLRFPTCGPWSSVSDSIELEEDPAPIPSGFETGEGEVDAGPPPTDLIIDFLNPGDVIEIGVPVQLQLTAVDADGEQSNVTDDATWGSDDGNIASVERGLVTGHAAGRTRITAEVRGKVAEFEIDVERGSPLNIVVEEPSAGVPVGRSIKLVATAHYPEENSENASTVGTWTSSDPNVATIDEEGTLVAVGEGTTEVTIELNGTTSEPIEVEVVPHVLDTIEVSRTPLGGNQHQLVAYAVYSDTPRPYENADLEDITDQVTWEQVSGEEFGTVDATGLLTVIQVGAVGVRVSLGGVVKQVNITVKTSAQTDAG